MPGLPPNGAEHGAQIDNLMLMVHILIAVVFVGWGIFLAAAIVRGRRSSGNSPASSSRLNRFGWLSEISIAVVEITLLVGVALPFWAGRIDAAPADRDATVVRVVAEQFAWNIHYPGPDGVFGRADISLVTPENPLGLDRNDPAAKDDITTLNVMHLPVRRPVVIYLSSKDVIHSFSLPLFRLKQDAIPGQRVRLWFIPEKTSAEMRLMMASSVRIDPADSLRDLSLLSTLEAVVDAQGLVVVAAGTPLTPDVIQALSLKGIGRVVAAPDTPTEIACAQLCGLGHYRMRGFVTIEPDSAYRAWMAEQSALLAQ